MDVNEDCDAGMKRSSAHMVFHAIFLKGISWIGAIAELFFAGNTAIPTQPNSQHNCGHTCGVRGSVGGPTVKNFLLRCVGVARHESLSA